MAFNFDQWIDRHHSDSLKWQKYGDRDVLPLWVADTDFRSPPAVIEALRQRIEHGVFGYGSKPADLIDLAIERMASRYGWQIEADWLVLLPGIVTGLNLCVRTFTSAGEVTVAPTPIYPHFRLAAAWAERKQINLQMRLENQRWIMDLAAAEMQLSGRERLLMLCNPHNPGGTVYRRAELMAQLRFAQRHDLIVCSDEIHCDLILEPGLEHIPFATLSEDAAQRSVTFISPSKTFNIAGLGASLAIIPNQALRQRFNDARRGIVPQVDILALAAATAAWRDGQPWLDALLPYLRRHRDWLCAQVNALPGLSAIPPEATYLTWISAHLPNVASPAQWFEKHGLGLSPGREFGDDGFVRFNFGCTRATLEEAVARLKQAVAAAED